MADEGRWESTHPHPLQRMDIALDHGVCVKGTGIPGLRTAELDAVPV